MVAITSSRLLANSYRLGSNRKMGTTKTRGALGVLNVRYPVRGLHGSPCGANLATGRRGCRWFEG
jgi:hypothetical protein